MSRFKTVFCIIPRRLARHIPNPHPDGPTIEFIGWAWMKEYHLTRNYNHGWIAFLDSKPMELRCPTCKQLLPPDKEV